MAPLPKPAKKDKAADADVEDNADGGEEAEEDEDEEEVAAAVDIASDATSSHISVDSRVECPPKGSSSDSSCKTFTSSSTSDSSSLRKPTKPKPAHGGALPADGGATLADGRAVGKRGKTGKIAPWWDFTYYYIPDNRHTAEKDCKIVLKSEFTTDAAFGSKDKSKTKTPHHFGENHDNPTRTHLLLRAWAFQRCSSMPFILAEGFRKRDFRSEEARLERDVANLHAKDKLLGHPAASRMFAEWVPAMAARLQAR